MSAPLTIYSKYPGPAHFVITSDLAPSCHHANWVGLGNGSMPRSYSYSEKASHRSGHKPCKYIPLNPKTYLQLSLSWIPKMPEQLQSHLLQGEMWWKENQKGKTQQSSLIDIKYLTWANLAGNLWSCEHMVTVPVKKLCNHFFQGVMTHQPP